MPDVIGLMSPIFILIAVGAVFVRFGLFPAEGLPTLNRFVMTGCIPVVLFSAVSSAGSIAEFNYFNALIYGVGSLLSAGGLAVFLRIVMGGPLTQSIILALGAGAANTIFLGFPIAMVLIPERAPEVFSWIVLAEILIVIPVMTSLALWAEGRAGGITARGILGPLAKSPVTIGLLSGFAFLATGLTLPAALQDVVRLIIQAAPFIALFLIGGMLVEAQLTRLGPRVLTITVAKLVVHPLLVGAAFAVVFGLDATTTRDAFLFAAMPLFTSYVVFSARHEVGDVAASAIVFSTLVGGATVTALIYALY